MKESFQPQKKSTPKFESHQNFEKPKQDLEKDSEKKEAQEQATPKSKENNNPDAYPITNPELKKVLDRIKENQNAKEDLNNKSNEQKNTPEKTEEKNKAKRVENKKIETKEISSSVAEIRDEIKGYEKQITQIERGEKGYNDKTGESSTIDQLHRKITEAEARLGNVEVDKNIQNLRDEIRGYEKQITKIERGEKGYNDKTGELSTIDQLHKKIADAENKLRELEKEKNSKGGEDEPMPPKPQEKKESEDTEPKPQPDPVKPPIPPVPPTPPEDVESLKTIEEAEREVNNARKKFIAEYRSFIEKRKEEGYNIKKEPEDSELPPELLEAREAYTKSKIELGKGLMQNKRASFEAGEESDIDEKLKEYKSSVVYDRVILSENDKLTEAKAELWKPKEKTIFRKVFNWYAKQSKMKKIAIGSIIATGGAVLGGGLTLPATALFAGSYMVRGLLGVSAGMLAGEAFSKIMKDKSGENYDSALEDLRKDFKVDSENTYVEEDKLQNIIKNRDSERAKYNVLKGLIVFGTSALVGSGLRSLEQSMIVNSTQDFEAAANAKAVDDVEIPEIKPMDDPIFSREGQTNSTNISDEEMVVGYNPYERINSEPKVVEPQATEAEPAVNTETTKQPDHGRSQRRTFQSRNMFSRGSTPISRW